MNDLSRPAAGPRPVRAPTGTTLHCKSWLTEAAYRMLQNNLDPAVAENPDALVDRKSTRLNSSHSQQSRMPSSA